MWVYAFWRACASKKGISALRLACEIEITHKSALFVLRSIRYGLVEEGRGTAVLALWEPPHRIPPPLTSQGRHRPGERPVDRFERDERGALRPLASRPYQRFGVHRGAEPAHRRVPETVEVQRRSLRVYAEATG